jgi:hypothetical protein
MTTKANRRPMVFPELDPLADLLRTPPLTTDERLLHIRALGQRLMGYVKFMCAVGSLSNSSTEAKQAAVAAFHERLVTLERELGRIQKNVRRRRNTTTRRRRLTNEQL